MCLKIFNVNNVSEVEEKQAIPREISVISSSNRISCPSSTNGDVTSNVERVSRCFPGTTVE